MNKEKPERTNSVDRFVLLPCPFCGSNPRVHTDSKMFPTSIECLGCYTIGPAVTRVGVVTDVISQWNTRRISGNTVLFQWEKPGVNTPTGGWFIIEGGYMYGPCESWQEIERIAREGRQFGRHITG